MRKGLILTAIILLIVSCREEGTIYEFETSKNNNDMALPLTGVSVSLVRSTLGASTNDVGLLCTHPNINRWSKRKPFTDNVITQTKPNWWRRSNVSIDIRSGFFLSVYPDSVWQYAHPTGGAGSGYRIGDFRGYDHTADPAFVLNFPSLFELGQDYEASFVMKGYDNIVVTEDDDIGSIGMQDIFDLENKYVCLGVKLQSPTQTVIRYGNQITYIANSILFGGNVVIPSADLIQILGQGGTIEMEIFVIEADEYIGGNFVNPQTYSIRAKSELITHQYNNQFSRAGFNTYSNFHTVEPTLTNGVVSSSGYEQVVFDSTFRTGGTITGYYFRARILGNQIGSDYTYPISTFTLAAEDTEIISIPSFTLGLLDQTGDCIVEYTLLDGSNNEVLRNTYTLQ